MAQLGKLPDEIDTIVLGGVDTHGVLRGKRVPRSQLERLLGHGLPLCDVFWVMHIDESALVPRPADFQGTFPTELTGYPDILAKPDTSTCKIVPWHPRTALMLCDWHELDGSAYALDPRGALKSMIGRSLELGYEPYCALELEFYLLREDSASVLGKLPSQLTPLTERPSTYGLVAASGQEPIGRVIRDLSLEFGLPIEACNPETGPGQFEITLEYRPALQAADDAFLFKTAVKEIAAQHGLLATFMAKPRADWAGNSCHVHFSMRDGDDQPVFYDASAQHGLSSVLRHFAAGSLEAMAELSALFAPTVNSYRRFVPYSWAATTATWGIDNRSTGIRVIAEGPNGTRIEHRRAGGDANPYLAAAGVLAGGLHGIVNAVEPPPLFEGDVYATDTAVVGELPTTLDGALDQLATSAIARERFGDNLIDHFIELKRAEAEAYRQTVTDWEVRRYLEAL
ncbi:MAG: glutamine synthetase [Nocardioidaceae bacterium]|nr:MAG: glutamine synthetase [Nocardioidaceae bacterium]